MARSTNPFRYFDSSPEVIRLVVMMYVKYPLSLRNVEDLLHERGIDICHETVRLWCVHRLRSGTPPIPRHSIELNGEISGLPGSRSVPIGTPAVSHIFP
jgi:hypothetical protein